MLQHVKSEQCLPCCVYIKDVVLSTFKRCCASALCVHTLMLCYSMLFWVIHILRLQHVTHAYVDNARGIVENYINSEHGCALHFWFYSTWSDSGKHMFLLICMSLLYVNDTHNCVDAVLQHVKREQSRFLRCLRKGRVAADVWTLLYLSAMHTYLDAVL